MAFFRSVVAALAFCVLAVPLTANGQSFVGIYGFNGPGPVTFGVALPAGVARSGLKLADVPSQTDVKTTWPDGSIRFAVVSAVIPAAGNRALLPDESGRQPSVAPRRPEASLTLSVDGRDYVSAPPGEPESVWLDGPVVHEARYKSGFPDAPEPARHLVVYWDVRTYANGAQRVEVAVQNSRDVAGAGNVIGGYRVMVGGVSRDHWPSTTQTGASPMASSGTTFTSTAHGLRAGDYVRIPGGANAGATRWVERVVDANKVVLSAAFPGTHTATQWQRVTFMHPYLSRWRKTYWVGGTEPDVRPDLESFHDAGALPRYRHDIRRTDRSASLQGYDILRLGDQQYPMTATGAGGREDVGPYPRWVAQYVVHRSQDLREYVLRNGDWAAGVWAAHITEADDSFFSLESHPNTAPFSSSSDGLLPLRNGVSNVIVYGAEAGAAHEPSLAYVPYLLTGDRFYLDEMKYWAHRGILTWKSGRGGAAGLVTSQQLRGQAWALRNLGDTVAYLPNDDPQRGYFGRLLASNLSDLALRVRQEPSPIGLIELGYSNSHPSTFQLSFFAWALHWLSVQHLDDEGKGTGYLDKILQWYNTGWTHPDFNREYLASYVFYARNDEQPRTGVLFSTWREFFEGNWGANGLQGQKSPPAWHSSYGVNVYLLMAVAAHRGYLGADQRAAWVLDHKDSKGRVLDDLAERGAYAVALPGAPRTPRNLRE